MSDLRLLLVASGYVGHPGGLATLPCERQRSPVAVGVFAVKNALPARGAEVAANVGHGDFLAFDNGRDAAAISYQFRRPA